MCRRTTSPCLPEDRNKRERQFPSLTPESPLVHFIWPDKSVPSEVLDGLRAVVARVTYLGHSSSLVSITLTGNPPPPRIAPDPDGAWGALRVPRVGHLNLLEHTFAEYASALKRTKGAAPRLPLPTFFMRYAEVRASEPAIAMGEFIELFIFALPAGCRLPLTATLRLTDVLRNAAMSLAQQPVVEELSGHQPNGAQSKKNRAAFVSLPHVAHGYADGHLLGLGVALPPLATETRKAVLTPISRIQHLTVGRAGNWAVTPSVASDVRGLQPITWIRPSRRWASVTPVVLHRYPRRHESATEIIAQSCQYAGLPLPIEIITTPASPFVGVADGREFRDVAGRPHTHVILEFDRAVEGPLLLGAGRYKGYGLCRPLETAA
jgi:CRISPR-associated protein Csb2